MSITTIDEKRLFKQIKYFFTEPRKVLIEIAQNSQRSGATKLDIWLKNGILTAKDNGKGCDNAKALFILASSDWDKEIELSQNPAGWGMMYLFSISDMVKMRSNFGTVTVDCPRFFQDSEYRQNILDTVDSKNTCDGFFILAAIKVDLVEKISQEHKLLQYFLFDITLNGNPVKRINIADHYATTAYLATSYKECDVIVLDNSLKSTISDISSFKRHLSVIWYGIPIQTDPFDSWCNTIIDVKNGSPLTPCLPYRESVQEDGKLEDLFNFIRRALVKHCSEYINDPANNDEYELRKAMDIMSTIASQEELNKLNRYYVSRTQPYYDDIISYYLVSREGKIPVNMEITDVRLINSKTKGSIEPLKSFEDELVLPVDSFYETQTCSRRPDWLDIPTRPVTIEIHRETDSEAGIAYSWYKAKKILLVDDSAGCIIDSIDILALFSSTSEGNVYYLNDPNDIWDISDNIFKLRILIEDFAADSYDSQEYYFEEDIQNDIMSVKNAYSLSELLKGFWTANIKPSEISSVQVADNSITVCRKDGTCQTINTY